MTHCTPNCDNIHTRHTAHPIVTIHMVHHILFSAKTFSCVTSPGRNFLGSLALRLLGAFGHSWAIEISKWQEVLGRPPHPSLASCSHPGYVWASCTTPVPTESSGIWLPAAGLLARSTHRVSNAHLTLSLLLNSPRKKIC